MIKKSLALFHEPKSPFIFDRYLKELVIAYPGTPLPSYDKLCHLVGQLEGASLPGIKDEVKLFKLKKKEVLRLRKNPTLPGLLGRISIPIPTLEESGILKELVPEGMGIIGNYIGDNGRQYTALSFIETRMKGTSTLERLKDIRLILILLNGNIITDSYANAYLQFRDKFNEYEVLRGLTPTAFGPVANSALTPTVGYDNLWLSAFFYSNTLSTSCSTSGSLYIDFTIRNASPQDCIIFSTLIAPYLHDSTGDVFAPNNNPLEMGGNNGCLTLRLHSANMRLDDLLFSTMYRYFLSPLVVNAVTKELALFMTVLKLEQSVPIDRDAIANAIRNYETHKKNYKGS